MKSQYPLHQGTQYWLFQANPKYYRIIDALKEKQSGWIWMVNQHKKRIRIGDKIVIWVCGRNAGAYALAEVESEVLMLSDFEDTFYIGSDKNGLRHRVRIKLTDVFTENPIPKIDILNSSILPVLEKGFRGTNLSINVSDFQTIKELIHS